MRVLCPTCSAPKRSGQGPLERQVGALIKQCQELEEDREYNAELVRERDAEIERLTRERLSLLAAYVRAFDGTYQSHTGHWDTTGQHGLGCPECKAAQDARREADEHYDHLRAREELEVARAAGGE